MIKMVLINTLTLIFVALTFFAALIGDSVFPELFGIAVK